MVAKKRTWHDCLPVVEFFLAMLVLKLNILYPNIYTFQTWHDSLSSKGYNCSYTTKCTLQVPSPPLFPLNQVWSFEDPKSQGSWLTHQMLNSPPALTPDHSQHAKWQLWTLKRFNNNSFISNYLPGQEIPSLLLDVRDRYRRKPMHVCVWLGVQIHLQAKHVLQEDKPVTM